MLTAIHILNPQGDTLELPLDASSGYVIKNIDGLGPVKADIVTTEYASMDGGVYQTAKGNMRNIVFQLGLDPTYESEDPFGELRRGLYPFLTPKMPVELHFLRAPLETVKIIGYVESFEPAIFSAEPEIQISILCPDPYFNALSMVVVNRDGPGTINITNPGTVDTGFQLTYSGISAPSLVQGNIVTVTRASPAWCWDIMTYVDSINTGANLMKINLITRKGSKAAEYVIHAVNNPGAQPDTNILGYMDGWLDVVPGPNTFLIAFAPGIANASTIKVALYFIPRYVGL